MISLCDTFYAALVPELEIVLARGIPVKGLEMTITKPLVRYRGPLRPFLHGLHYREPMVHCLRRWTRALLRPLRSTTDPFFTPTIMCIPSYPRITFGMTF